MFSKDSRRPDGLRNACRVCCKAQNQHHYATRQGEMQQRSRDYRAANPEKVAAYNREYANADHGRAQAATKRWREAHPEAERASAQKSRAKHRDTILARKKAYRAANKDKVDASIKAWRVANKDRVKTLSLHHCRVRQTSKLQAIPGWADDDQIRHIYEKAKEWSAVLGIELHVDHTIPLKSPLVCGLHCPDNLQLLEKSINISKGNRTWPDMPENI
jgi:hypothetical protein